MTKLMEKARIIMLKEEGLSNRAVARKTGHDRKTVAKYWNAYRTGLKELETGEVDVKEAQEALLSKPQYNSANRKRHK